MVRVGGSAKGGLLALHLKSAAVFVIFGGAAFIADWYERPITCALVFVFGVMIIAGLEGALAGAVVAVGASLIYSFAIRDPAFSFSLSSADDLVPIIAFNISAVATGIFAGRLKDRIKAAEAAVRRVSALFRISTLMHSATTLKGMIEALERFTGNPAEIYVGSEEGHLVSFTRAEHKSLAANLLAHSGGSLREANLRGFKFVTPSGAPCLAIVDVRRQDDLMTEEDVGAVVGLLNVSLERCLLLEHTRSTAGGLRLARAS